MTVNGHRQGLHLFSFMQITEHLSRFAVTSRHLSPPEWSDTTFSKGYFMSFSRPDFSHLTVGIVGVCALLVFGTLPPANAKHEHEESIPEATDPESPAPGLSVPEYRSPLSAYQPFEDAADSLDWKEANDRVGEIGGWRVYSRELFESEDTHDKDMDSK